MSTRSLSASSLSAGDLASALVASCVVMGGSPAEVFEPHLRRARILAGAALKAATGLSAVALTKPLRLASTELAPSMLARHRITTDMLLEVVEAIGGPAGAAALSQGLASPEAASAAVEDPAPVAEAIAASTPVSRQPRPTASPSARKVTEAEVIGGQSSPRRARMTAEERREYLAPRKVATPAEERGPIIRLRPVTARVARYAAWFLAAEWELDEVAGLFNVGATALADALEFGVAA